MDGTFEQPQPSTTFKVRLDEDMSAERAFKAIGFSCVDQLRANENAVLQTRTPEAVHQMRVALRRWRTALSVFRKLFEHGDDSIRSELIWLSSELDEARDLDVFVQDTLSFGSFAKSHAKGYAALDEAASRAKDQAYQRAADAIGSDRYRKLLWEGARSIEALGRAVPDHGAPTARNLARRALIHHGKAVKAAGAHLTRLDPEARHHLRIKAKKARYTAELFSDLFGHPRRQRRFNKALKDLQDALGELNDIHVAQDLAQRLAQAAGTPEAGFVAGLILGARSPAESSLFAEAAAAYDRFAKVKPFW